MAIVPVLRYAAVDLLVNTFECNELIRIFLTQSIFIKTCSDYYTKNRPNRPNLYI